MRLSPLNYRSLFILYGLSVVVLLPFGALYAYLEIHGWNRDYALIVCLMFGVLAALSLWSRIEPRLLATQLGMVNLDPIAPNSFATIPLPQLVAVGAFAVVIICTPVRAGRSAKITGPSAVIFRALPLGIQSPSAQVATTAVTGAPLRFG